jgi:hypothetical protein
VERNFDVKDLFNNIIAGILWLLLFFQVDFWFFDSKLFCNVKNTNIPGYEPFFWSLCIVFALFSGTLLRPLERLPLFIFKLLFGDPLKSVLEKKEPKCCIDCLRMLLVCLLRLKCKVRQKMPSSINVAITNFFNTKKLIIKEPINKLIYIQYFNELKGLPRRYERMKNYKNLIESIMLPEILNVGLILIFGNLFRSPAVSPEPWRIVLFVFNVWIIYNRYEYYTVEYYQSVFRSILGLIEQEQGEEKSA